MSEIDILSWVNSNGLLVILLFWVLSALLNGMPPPPENASLWYRWAYDSAQILSSNIKLARLRAPGDGRKVKAQVKE